MRILFFFLLLPFVFFAQQPVKSMPKKDKLNLLVHPADLLVCENMPVVFRAFAACPPPEVPEYQWQISTDGIRWDDIVGETNSEFTRLGLAKRAHNASQFRVLVSAAGETITSFPALLTVESGLYFTKNPEKQTVPEGGTAIFQAAVAAESGNGVAAYQWQFSPYASGVWRNIPAANRPTLKLDAVTTAENGNSYRLLARTFSNCDSAVSAPAFLVVSGKPVVNIVPLEKTLCGDGVATFTVQVQGGNGTEKCQWQLNKNGKGDFKNIPEEQNFSINIKNITTEMNGWEYRAIVNLADGTAVATQPGKLTVHGSVAFSKHPSSVAVCLGDAVTFHAMPTSDGREPDCTWQTSTDGGNYWRDLPATRGIKLEIPAATPDLNGHQFRAVAVSGLCGTAHSRAATLTVFAGVKFTQHPRDQKANLGSPVTFSAEYEALEGGDYSTSWEWSATSGFSWQFMPGGKGNKLLLPDVKAEMKEYLFRMKVLDRKCGRISYSEPARVLLD